METKMILGFVYGRKGNGSYDGTNGGVSANAEQVMLYRTRADYENDPHKDKLPALILCGEGTSYPHAEPLTSKETGMFGYMDGGNFAYSSDSRWPSKQPIAIHDRVETRQQYTILSR